MTEVLSVNHCGIDAIFVIDGSGSIEREDFGKALKFVNLFVTTLDIDSGLSRIGVIVFNSSPSVVLKLAKSTELGKEKTKQEIDDYMFMLTA